MRGGGGDIVRRRHLGDRAPVGARILTRSNNVNDNELATLAAWLRSEPLAKVKAYASAIGIPVDEQDCIELFHYINATKEQSYERRDQRITCALRSEAHCIWQEPA
jgi:hypothetical protein